MATITELCTVPSFTFYQDNEGESEQPINVRYWNGSVELEQGNNSVLINPDNLKALFKAIDKNLPEAKRILDKR
jgi:hypothetical protein